jgi:hypothetical protein
MERPLIFQGVFLRWWLLLMLISIGAILAIGMGVLDSLIQADVTRISFLIFAIFVVYTAKAGRMTHRAYKGRPVKALETVWFVSDQLLTLGMIGTVIGFIYMLSTNFCAIDASNSLALKRAMGDMSIGMGTALYTTAAGLITSLLLKAQAFNIARFLEGKESEDEEAVL